MAELKRFGTATALAAAFLLLGRDSRAGNQVYVEGADDYYAGCHSPALGYSQTDATGFLNIVPASAAGFFARTPYFNQNSWTSDFMDPEKTSVSADTDWIWFDKNENALSYFSGHGGTANGDTELRSYEQYCTNDTQCGTIPTELPAAQFPSHCHRYPGNLDGHCSYSYPAGRKILLSSCAWGPPDRNGQVPYGLAGAVKWGESTYAGSWGGAGTNGGANFVGLAISHAELSLRGNEVWQAFGGIHMLATSFSHTGDHLNEPNRGLYFGIMAYANAYSSVAQSFLSSMNSLPSGTGCTNYAGTVSYGGGHGQSNCGGHMVTSIGADYSAAFSSLNENWYQIKPRTFSGPRATPAESGLKVFPVFSPECPPLHSFVLDRPGQ